MKKKSRTAATNLSLFLIALPGILYLLINNYAPMLGIFLAFKNYSTAALLGTGSVDLPGTAIRMAMAVIGILPILLVYPFIQKYLVRGVVVGAVKG